MKDHLPAPPQQPPAAANSPKVRRVLAKATTFILLFSLGYTFGILSASFPFSARSLPQFSRQSESQPQPTSFPNPTPPLPPQPVAAAVEQYPSRPPHDLFRFRTRCAPPVPQSEILSTVLDRVFNGTSPYAGFPAPETAALLRPVARRPRGWGSTMPVFADLIAAVRPRTIIELGTFLGASALHMAAVSRNLSLDPVLILCLDDFRGWPEARGKFAKDMPEPRHGEALLLPQFMRAVAAAGEEARVIPFPFSTGSGLAALCEWGVYGDLIEVDAGHDFHSAWADINMAYAVLRPGGVLFGHDYLTAADDHGVRRAVTLFAKTKGVRVRRHGQHWVLDPKPRGH